MHDRYLNEARHHVASQPHFCIVTETYPPEINGVAHTLAYLVQGLRGRGCRVSIVRPRQESFDSHHCDHDSTVTLVPAVPLPGYRELKVGLPASRKLWRCWLQRRPDVVYVATEGPLGWSAVRAAKVLGIPVFSGFHTNFDSYSGYYHAGWLGFLIFRYLRRFHNRTAGTLVATVELRDRLLARGFHNVSILGRGVDGRLFNPARRSAELRRMWGATDRDLVVLYVGRVAPEKNLGLALEAFRAMQRVNQAVKFVIVGDGPLRTALQTKHPDLIFCGVHKDEDLAKRYASADVFLFPSETETFGNVILEAMASGLVVVAYDYAAARLHVANGATGLLVPCGQPSEFVSAALKLAGEPQSLTKIRHQARERALALDWQCVVERFARTLTEGLGEGSEADAEAVTARIGTVAPAVELR